MERSSAEPSLRQLPSQERCHIIVDMWRSSVMLHTNANCECKRKRNIIATLLTRSRLSSWCVEGNKWSTDYLEYDIRKVPSWFLEWCFINLAWLFLFYKKFSSSFTPFTFTLYNLNIRPHSSETEEIMRTACFQSGSPSEYLPPASIISFIFGGSSKQSWKTHSRTLQSCFVTAFCTVWMSTQR